jgi:hypothetical protein
LAGSLVGTALNNSEAQSLYAEGGVFTHAVGPAALLLFVATVLIASAGAWVVSDEAQRVHVGPGFANKLYMSIDRRDESLLPATTYRCDLANNGVLVLRDNGDKRYSVEGRKVLLRPTEHSYDILNLRALATQQALSVSTTTTGGFYTLHFKFSVNTITDASLVSLSNDATAFLDSSVVQVYLDMFFRTGDRARELDSVVREIVREWFTGFRGWEPGEWRAKLEKLRDRVQNVQGREPAGTTKDGVPVVRLVDGTLEAVSNSRSSLQLQGEFTIAKARNVADWLRELDELRMQLRDMESNVNQAFPSMRDRFSTKFHTAIASLYFSADNPLATQTPILQDFDQQIEAVLSAINVKKDFDATVVAAQSQEQTRNRLVEHAMHQDVPYEPILNHDGLKFGSVQIPSPPSTLGPGEVPKPLPRPESSEEV